MIKLIAWVVGSWLLVLASETSQAGDLNCPKASTLIEHLTCGDRGLRARDAIMDKLYKAAMEADDKEKVRASQQNWLSKLQACSDAACVKQSYDARISELMSAKGREKVETRYLRYSRDQDQGNLLIVGPVDEVAAVSISATHVGGRGVAEGDVNASGADGVITLERGRGQIDNGNGCTVSLQRVDARSWRVTQARRCADQFAVNVSLDGLYRH